VISWMREDKQFEGGNICIKEAGWLTLGTRKMLGWVGEVLIGANANSKRNDK
jgi:hypothetical protein